jgi:hypothetical protein
MKYLYLVGLLGFILSAAPAITGGKSQPQDRDTAKKAFDKGNFKDAFDLYSRLALDPADDPVQVSTDLTQALQCLRRLGRVSDIDDFREKVIAAHGKNWKLLQTAAQTYAGSANNGEHFGSIVAGKFYRGNQRGGDGKRVFTGERDRIRALQLMVQASENLRTDTDKDEMANFDFAFADMLLDARRGDGAWRFQYLTDLGKLPDYEDNYPYYYGGNGRGAPVNEDGSPVFHSIPKTWKDARTDGERWRWCLAQAQELSPENSARSRFVFAEFLRGQFDVQTMAAAGYGRLIGRSEDDGRKDENGPYAVGTLKEDETIARLATGIKRFKLPEEFNFIKILQQVGDSGNKTYGENAVNLLAQLFEDRQQYDRAAEFWKKSIEAFGPGTENYKQKKVDQILGNWGRFDPNPTEPAGKEPVAHLVFRNGKKVSFEAYEIDVKKLLDDVKAYIKTKPRQLNWEQINIGDIGWRLVEKDQKQYIGKQAAKWEMALDPRDKHFDRRVPVTVPIKTPGAYLIKAQMDGGNLTQIVLWVADTIIVKKPLDNGSYYFLADAVSGQPVGKTNLEFFGYRQEWKGNNNYQIDTQDFAEFTDADGQLKLKKDQQAGNYSWLITATTPQGRLAYLGFSGIWGGRIYDAEYNQVKVFAITDRPVYRPGQPVKFKFWLGHAKYDQEGPSFYGNKSYTITVNSPRGEKFWEKTFNTDVYGGLDGELEMPRECQLGTYQIFIQNLGGGNFRVEEYKKPEFEVKVDAPAEPVMLGEKISATVTAKYYFGAPVTQAKVKYKVLRTSHHAQWYPTGYWDWFYEPGYWWFACDYTWYPGWERWGCARPWRWWWPQRWERPEVVLENEAAVGADGTIKIEIDTALAKAVHGDEDHKYEITAEVTDDSRRTIVGQGSVLVARKPFKVYAWVNRGHYLAGDVVLAEFSARTLDNKPVQGKGELKLFKVTYKPAEKDPNDLQPVETQVEKWALDTNEEGVARQQLKAAAPGQYRLSYTVADKQNHAIEGGYVFVVRGEGFDGKQFRFNDIELTTDKREYQAGDTVKLMVNTNRADAAVLVFLRPSNGVYLAPKLIRLAGKSTVEEIAVVQRDMPNFFVEALTVSNARIYDEMREIVVPPESRVINVDVLPSAKTYKPGEKAKVQFKLTDTTGKPLAASAVISVYDKAVEYISGGSNVPEIKAFFWKWRRHHSPQTESNLRTSGPLAKSGSIIMQYLGVFGGMVADEDPGMSGGPGGGGGFGGGRTRGMAAEGKSGGDNGAMLRSAMTPMAPMAAKPAAGGMMMEQADSTRADKQAGLGAGGQAPDVQPTVRSNFADTALWVASLTSNNDGIGEVELTMPENLSTWKTKVWSMGSGTRVGQGDAEVVTTKNLLVRLQAPRFFVQKDEVVLSANIHNYLKTAKKAKAVLELTGDCLMPLDGNRASLTQTIEVAPNVEKRVDWRVLVVKPGEATIRISGITDEESDAMQMSFPVYIHGMLKTDSFSGAMRPADKSASITINVPAERIPEQSRLEVRYSPSVASAMVDALPYLIQNPHHGTTDETIASFLPAVITQRILLDMKLDLKAIKAKRTNLNAQEIGDDAKRAQDWKRMPPEYWEQAKKERNPVWDEDEMRSVVKAGVNKLTNMQLSDGGWGWFFGFGEYSSPHTTALVVHGLQVAQANDIALVPGVMERGVDWLKRHQAEQVRLLTNAATKTKPWKDKADNLDAFVHMVLVDAGVKDANMLNFLFRDRIDLSAYAKAMLGLSLHKLGEKDRLATVLENLSQFVVKDDANQTAYLKLPDDNYWWCWYGSDVEAMGYYLKLLCRTNPKSDVSPRMAKYLINNRKHATYWNSTRDTAIAIEALAEYIRASGEDKPDMTVQIAIDGKQVKDVKIDATNLFSFDNKLVITGADVPAGKHKIEFTKTGTGPLYFNAYVTNFTLEDPIKRAGLEVTVNRKFYKLVPVDQKIKVSGSRGQALDQKVEKFQRQALADGAVLKSGDMVEVEMEIDSKNDYEYLMFEDFKASGFEPVELRSGYNGNDLHAYMELHDERVSFFCRELARGKHSVAYRLRAEIPGKFSALPSKGSAVYAPELKANSDEAKLSIQD